MTDWTNPTNADLERLAQAVINDPTHFVKLLPGQRDDLDAIFNPVEGQVVSCGKRLARCVSLTVRLDNVTCRECIADLVGY